MSTKCIVSLNVLAANLYILYKLSCYEFWDSNSEFSELTDFFLFSWNFYSF